MGFPLLTEYDPETKAEGTLDPLGTYSIADKLAVRLVPGFRERMRRPRFLTAMAVGAVVCNEFDTDFIAKDEISAPWQVYEWHVVQALVKRYRGKSDIIGLPGSDKASRAMNHDLKLNASRYLKTPSVFGFHGVYRTLATEVDVIYSENLGEGGDRLVRAWERDQKLSGFLSQESGEGRQFRNNLFYAVKDGLAEGEVKRSWSWQFFSTIAERLVPSGIGNQEGKVLYELILLDNKGFREFVIPALIEFYKNNSSNGDFSESVFFKELFQKSNGNLKQLLRSIIDYETFSRILTNAFEEILFFMSEVKKQTDFNDLLHLTSIQNAIGVIDNQYKKTLSSFTENQDQYAFQHTFDIFEHIGSAHDFVEALIQHHKNIQKNKPPNGKMDWVVQTDTGKWLIKPNYIRNKKFVLSEDSFVHFYRSNSLKTFLQDLRKI